MYYENPAVTFTIPGSGVNYVSLNGETGIEVRNGDYKAFAEAVKQLAEDPKRRQRLGQHARERVMSHFLFSQFRDRIYQVIVQ